jgi:hypothetical protein
MLRYLIIILAVVLVFPAVRAQPPSNQELEPVPAPPEIPESMESGQPIEPEVTIIRKEKETIHEYRINGVLYMVKIVPVVGKPYYLIDNDGDGRLESRRTGIYDDGQVPQWVLFSW